jgi:Skp family chaperone for outer membrane proteins
MRLQCAGLVSMRSPTARLQARHPRKQRRAHVMKQRLILLVAAALSLAILGMAQNPPATPPAAPAQAAAPAAIGPVKVAFANIQQIIYTCDEGKRDAATLQQYIDGKNSELQKLTKELEGLRSQLEVQGSKLTDEARAELAETIDAKDTNFQRFQQDTQKDIDARRAKLQNAIARKMLPVIEKLAKEKGLHAVQFLDTSNIFAYVDPSLIISDEIIKAYNAAFPAAAPAAAPVKK